MDEEKYNTMRNALRESMRIYPNCKIAGCDCDSKNGERIEGCHCLCHIDDIKKEIESRDNKIMGVNK